MATRHILFMIPVLLMLVGACNASVTTALQGYGVPNALIANLTTVSITTSGHAYDAMYLGNTLYFVINASNGDSMVLGSQQIAAVITNYTVSTAYGEANFTQLDATVNAYVASGNKGTPPPLTSCLENTGLNRYSCTKANNCEACQTVPACNIYYGETDQVTGPLFYAINGFEINYTEFEQNLDAFSSTVNAISISNVSAQISTLNSAYAGIAAYSEAMDQIGIMTVPQNLTPQLSNCGYYGSSGGPWYCHTISICTYIPWNYTILNNAQTQLNAIASLPLTSQAVLQIAVRANDTENTYVLPTLSKQKKAQLSVVLNTTFMDYATLVNASKTLLMHISNATLSARLTTAENEYAQVNNNYLTENFTAASAAGANVMANLTGTYTALNASYSTIYDTAKSNTELLVSAQLNSQVPSSESAELSFRQIQLDSQISGVIPNVTASAALLAAVHANATSVYSGSTSFSLSGAARTLDQPFIGMLGYYSGQPYQANVALAPLYGAILSLIIGIVILLLVMLGNHYMRSRNRIMLTKQVQKNWYVLYALVLLLVIVYVAATYTLLSNASAFSPVSAFQSSVASAQYVAMVENGTQSQGGINCINMLITKATQLNKKPIIAQLSGGTCTIGNVTETADFCMNYFAYTGTPVVELTSSQNSTVSTYTLYGSQLRVTGSSSELNTCYASLLLGGA